MYGGRFRWRMEEDLYGGWRMEDGGWRKALDIIHFSKTLYLYLALSSKSERLRKMNDL